MDIDLQETKDTIDEIKHLFKKINDDFFDNLILDKQIIFKYNLSILNNNLDTIKENLYNLINTNQVDKSDFNIKIKEDYNEKIKLHNLCKNIFPILFPLILNYNDTS